jgi:hypothetical protein
LSGNVNDIFDRYRYSVEQAAISARTKFLVNPIGRGQGSGLVNTGKTVQLGV